MILKIWNRLSGPNYIFIHLSFKMDVKADHNNAQGAHQTQTFLLLTKEAFLAELHTKQ